LSVRYLKRTASGFEHMAGDPRLDHFGDGFGAPPNWSVRRDLEIGPVLVIETGYTGQGCTVANQSLVELMPSGPRKR
ncbi:hypothetical protein ACXYUI_33070, partial [Klebsiella pneumoniae]